MVQSRFAPISIVAATLLLLACGASDDGTQGTATANLDRSTVSAESTTASSVPEQQDDPAAREGLALAVCDGCVPAEVDSAWTMSSRTWFAYDVAQQNPVPVTAEPSFGADVVAELEAGAAGLTVFIDTRVEGWFPVAVDGGAGWVPEQFLRPEPAVAEPLIVGSAPPGVAAIADGVVAALSDGPGLSAFVGEAGLLISLDGEVTDADVTVSAAELADSTAQDRDWGPNPAGTNVALTLDGLLFELAGSPALTSTERIGFDDPTTSLAQGAGSGAFPGATVVEYRFGGTESVDQRDWATVTVLIDTTSGDPVPVAIVNDAGPG